MRRVPLFSTLVVLLAAAAMVWLGLWQLGRRAEKEALISRYAANATQPPAPFESLLPVTDAVLFRRTAVMCHAVSDWRTGSARDVHGGAGWRHTARCRTGMTMPLIVDMGVSATPDAPRWEGGTVRGVLVWAPDQQPLAARLFGNTAPRTPMIVSAAGAPGLQPTAMPDPAALPNNHLAYAVQWFLFAAVAVLIYAILLWRRRRVVAPAGLHR
jgi:surfeit locus 1 family protein